MTRSLSEQDRQTIADILVATYSNAPIGLVDEIDELFSGRAWAPYEQPLFIQVRDSIWLTFPSKEAATRTAESIFRVLDREDDITR